MYKEIIIIIVVISLVLGLDIITNNYTKQSLEIITYELNVLREYISEARGSKPRASFIKV